MKRLLSIFLIVALTVAYIPASAAEEVPNNTVDSVFYGVINVRAGDAQHPEPYRAARDQSGNVFVQLTDFANMIGASLEVDAENVIFYYRYGYWRLEVYCRQKTARVFYNPSGLPDEIGYPIYDDFPLTLMLYNENQGGWYAPMDEMLYITHRQWLCLDEGNFVSILHTETILDVIPEIKEATGANNPCYEDLMGNTLGEQIKNSGKYAFLAAADELSTTSVFWEPIAIHFSNISKGLYGKGFKDSTVYEAQTLKETLLLLANDYPGASKYNISLDAKDSFSDIADFLSATYATIGAADTGVHNELCQELLKAAGKSVTLEFIDSLDPYINGISLSEQMVNIVWIAAESIWLRDNLPESFKNRLTFLQDVTDPESDNPFVRRLHKAAEDSCESYYDSFLNVIKNEVNLDHLMGTAESLLGTFSNFNPLSMPLLIINGVDLLVEQSKNNPIVAQALEEGETAHIALNLINIHAYIGAHTNDLLRQLAAGSGVNEKTLHQLRHSCQIALNSGAHALDKLHELNKARRKNYHKGISILQRINATEPFDKVLFIDGSFSRLYSDDPGCIRDLIPPEYVYSGDGIFLAPVNQLTKAPAGYTPIFTENDLLNIQNKMAGHYILMADLKFDRWTPLGSDDNPFTGIFDGNGYSVTINTTEEIPFETDVAGGLFYWLNDSALVKNLHIKGQLNYSCQKQEANKQFYGNMAIGGIAAYISGESAVINCVSSVNIDKYDETASFWYSYGHDAVAGIVGTVTDNSSGVRISYCRNFGNMESGNDTAGIVAYAGEATIFACQNEGTIYSKTNAGGIACKSEGSIQYCANLGAVTGFSGASGGIAETAQNITGCVNLGTVYTEGSPIGYSGGIAASTKGTIRDCINVGSVGRFKVGICCSVKYGKLINCYWLDNCEYLYTPSFSEDPFNKTPDDIGKLTAKEMVLKESYPDYNFIGQWTFYDGMRCPYPSNLLLNGQTPPMIDP